MTILYTKTDPISTDIPVGGTLSINEIPGVDIPAGSSVQITVNSPPPPVTDFVGAPLSGIVPFSVQFNDLSTGSPTGWAWDFGDGGTDTVQNPVREYAAAGTFDVKLTANNAWGSNAKVKTGYVVLTNPNPPPPTGPLTDLVEWWALDEVSDGTANVPRLGSLSPLPALHPAQINLKDNGNVPGNNGAAIPMLNAHSLSATVDGAIFQGANGSWTFFARVGWDTLPNSSVTLAGRNVNLSWKLYLDGGTKKFILSSVAARTGVRSTVTCPVVAQAGHNYSVAAGWNVLTGKLFIVVVADNGTLTRVESASSVGRRSVTSTQGYFVGGGHLDPLQGKMYETSFYHDALTDAQIQVLHNAGTPLTFSPSLLAAPRDCGPAPFSALTLVTANLVMTAQTGTAGLYWMSCRNLAAWSPSLAATFGNYIWIYTTDHPATNGKGVYLGFSSDPGIVPTSWTMAVPGIGTAHCSADTFPDRNYIDIEAAMLCWDAVNQKVRIYVHLETASGGPYGTGLSGPTQEGVMFDSSDLVTWTSRGVVNPAFPASGNLSAVGHTGYACVLAPGELPNNPSAWVSYHYTYDATLLYRCNVSSDGKMWNAAADVEELDSASPFPAGYDSVQWWNNVFQWNGKVYGIGRGNFPGGKGVIMAELAVENGTYRLPTGKIWSLIYATDFFPTIGYIQDVRATPPDANGIVHLYVLRGFYLNSGDERIDHYTLKMN